MDKWILILILLMALGIVSMIYVRRQHIKEKEQSELNPTADDFEILD